jgi:hypothetical protein
MTAEERDSWKFAKIKDDDWLVEGDSGRKGPFGGTKTT